MMLASGYIGIPFYRGNGRQRGRGFGALAEVIGRTAIRIFRKYIVAAAEGMGAGFLEFAVPQIADIIDGRKIFQTAAKIIEHKLWEIV